MVKNIFNFLLDKDNNNIYLNNNNEEKTEEIYDKNIKEEKNEYNIKMSKDNISQLNKYINLEKKYLETNSLLKKNTIKKQTLEDLTKNILTLEKNIEKYFKKPIIKYISQKRKRLKKNYLHKNNQQIKKKTLKQNN